MKFLRVSWPKTKILCEKLGRMARQFKPEALVGISRGGLVPVRLISDILGIHTVGIMRIEFYKSMAKTSEFPKITQGLQIDLAGKAVLVVDDVSDTGRSLAVAKEYLKQKGAREVRFATLHFKPHSLFKPDYYIEKTDKWIIYPWEIHEVENELKRRKRKKGKK